MPTMNALVLLTFGLCCTLVLGGVFYLVHTRPALNAPLTTTLLTLAALAALVTITLNL